MLRTAGMIAGAAGILIFFLPVFAGIFNFGVLAGTLLSACLFGGCRLQPRLQTMAAANQAVRIFLLIIQAGYVLFLAIAAAACLQMYRETRNLPSEETDQTMIVLGCGLEGERPSQMLWRRLTAAQAYLQQHPDIPVIVSGGQGSDEIMTEAQCMKIRSPEIPWSVSQFFMHCASVMISSLPSPPETMTGISGCC